MVDLGTCFLSPACNLEHRRTGMTVFVKAAKCLDPALRHRQPSVLVPRGVTGYHGLLWLLPTQLHGAVHLLHDWTSLHGGKPDRKPW